MKFEHYLKKLEGSEEYKKFRRKYKDEYLCAGFFVLDFEGGKDVHQIDYRLPNGKIATFFLDGDIKLKISEQAVKKDLPKVGGKINTDIEALKGIVEDEMKNRTVTEKIRKMIAILHTLDNRPVWNLQCILDGLGILLVHIDDSDQTVLKFERHSLMDLIKQVPGQISTPAGKTDEEKAPKASMEELKKLQEKIEEAIKKSKKGKKKILKKKK